MSRRIIWMLGIGLLVLSQVSWAGVRASVDRNRVYEGDTLTLTLEADGNVQGSPDLGALRADFEVLGTGRSSNISIVNGRQSFTTGWQVSLRPRRLGDLIVPPIEIDGEKTRAIVVHVEKVPPEVAKRNAEQLFVETEVDSGGHDPYVQQQVKLVVRLYYRVRLLDGELSEPQPDGDVVFERLGDDRRYETIRNGKRYKVIEREYAMFPQRSGELRIPSVVFNGRVALRQPPRRRPPSTRMEGLIERFFGDDPFMDDFFTNSPFGQRGKRVVARSPSRTLKVLPPPKDYHGGDWLPAADIELHDSWTDAPPTPRVGEPVTRVLTLRAKGLEASQLPEPAIEPSAGYKVYPEASTTRDQLADGWVVGEIRREFAIVPTRPGKLVLPEIRVHWWDTRENRERDTVLPRWELKVLPGVKGQAPSAPPPSAAATPTSNAKNPPSGAAPESLGKGDEEPASWWPWLAALGALLVALAIARWARKRHGGESGAPVEAPSAVPRGALGAARRALREACGRGDSREVARAILALARAQWPERPPLDLRALARRVPGQAARLERLDRALFSGGSLDAAELKALCDDLRNGLEASGADDARKQEDADLAPLYPG